MRREHRRGRAGGGGGRRDEGRARGYDSGRQPSRGDRWSYRFLPAQAGRFSGRLVDMEQAAVVDRGSPPLALRLVAVVTASDDQLTLQRMAAAVLAGGLGRPLRASGVEEASLAVGSSSGVLVFACDVSASSGIASLRRLRKLLRSADIVVVSPATHASGVRRALDAGADGLVFESELEDSLVPSVAAVAAGQTAVPRRVRAGLHKPAFSHRERQVIG